MFRCSTRETSITIKSHFKSEALMFTPEEQELEWTEQIQYFSNG